MILSDLAGKPAPSSLLVDVSRLVDAYYNCTPDPQIPGQRVSFGTSGHRGSSLQLSFNEAHILAISQAICQNREARGVTGPLFLGMDTHALSRPAFQTALEVFCANGVHVIIQEGLQVTPTPVISRAILSYNRGRQEHLADGVVITPSHNPPEDGGFKYNPPHGGPAETEVTLAIEELANRILQERNRSVRRVAWEDSLRSSTTTHQDLLGPYVRDLKNVLDMQVIASCGIRIGVDPMGGATLPLWELISETYGVQIHVVNQGLDPAFGFMHLDHDSKIRMDCSSPYAMAGLIKLKDRFDIAFGNDPDGDRHGIVDPKGGLLNPNHYLAAAAWYLFQNRGGWSPSAMVGKTVVTSSMMDRVASSLGRGLAEVAVGFKWFVEGLLAGSLGFAGEESAGASFLCMDGSPWTTDKDGVILGLLAAEMIARTGQTPHDTYRHLESLLGRSFYERVDTPVDAQKKRELGKLSQSRVRATQLGGEPVVAILDKAPIKEAPIGGIKVVAPNGWFAARPSGTEDIYKLYAESFISPEHLKLIQQEAFAIIQEALESAARP